MTQKKYSTNFFGINCILALGSKYTSSILVWFVLPIALIQLFEIFFISLNAFESPLPKIQFPFFVIVVWKQYRVFRYWSKREWVRC